MQHTFLRELFKICRTRSIVVSLAVLIVVIMFEIGLTCAIPAWRNYFYGSLEAKDVNSFYHSLLFFFFLMGGLGASQGLKVWLGQLFSFKVRTLGTKLLFKKWVKGDRTAANYTQSMTESLRNMTEGAVELTAECAISLAIVMVLMVRSMHDWPILVASLAFTAVVSALAVLFNKPLTTSNIDWQIAEGQLRETIGDVAHNKEDFSFKDKLTILGTQYFTYSKVLMYYTLFSRMKASLSSLVPYVLLSGAYFAGTSTLGQFMDGVGTFELIVVNTTILLVLYPRLVQVRASYLLVNEFFREVRDGPIEMSNTKA